jgi:hypothetical protein
VHSGSVNSNEDEDAGIFNLNLNGPPSSVPSAFCSFYNTRIHSHLFASVPFAFSVRCHVHVQIVHLRTTSAGCARTCVDSGAVSTFRTKTLARKKMKLKQTGMAMNNAL